MKWVFYKPLWKHKDAIDDSLVRDVPLEFIKKCYSADQLGLWVRNKFKEPDIDLTIFQFAGCAMLWVKRYFYQHLFSNSLVK